MKDGYYKYNECQKDMVYILELIGTTYKVVFTNVKGWKENIGKTGSAMIGFNKAYDKIELSDYIAYKLKG